MFWGPTKIYINIGRIIQCYYINESKHMNVHYSVTCFDQFRIPTISKNKQRFTQEIFVQDKFYIRLTSVNERSS